MKINFKADLYQKLLEEANDHSTSIPRLVVEILTARYVKQENTNDSNIGASNGQEVSGVSSNTKGSYPEEEDL